MYLHRVLLLLIPAVYILLPLIIDWWKNLEGPWFLTFSVWLGVVIIAFIIEQRRKHA